MREDLRPETLLAAALIDKRFRLAMCAASIEDSGAVFEALEAGIGHPKAAAALEWVDHLTRECRDLIAEYEAEQDKGIYPIHVYGFDQLCIVWAPEYKETGPFTSIESAMRYVEREWSEFLSSDHPKFHRLPDFEPTGATAALRSAEFIPAPSIYRIGDYDYSKIGDGQYKRHRKRFLDGDEVLSTHEMVERLSASMRSGASGLLKQIGVAGWHELADEVAVADRRRRLAADKAERQRKRTLRLEVVEYIDNFLGGRDDPEGRLIDQAALEWSWGGRADMVIKDDEESAPNPMYARQRYYEALNLYAAAKRSAKAKITAKTKGVGDK